MIRPGVPTMMCTPRRRAFSCTAYPCPPYTGSTCRPGRCAAYRSKASHTCRASSRVGHNTRACGAFWVGSIRARIGSANAAVFPVPVWARPTTCRPASSGGIVAAWIGVGVS